MHRVGGIMGTTLEFCPPQWSNTLSMWPPWSQGLVSMEAAGAGLGGLPTHGSSRWTGGLGGLESQLPPQWFGFHCASDGKESAYNSVDTGLIPWTEEPGGLQSRGCKESDMTEWLALSLFPNDWEPQGSNLTVPGFSLLICKMEWEPLVGQQDSRMSQADEGFGGPCNEHGCCITVFKNNPAFHFISSRMGWI